MRQLNKEWLFFEVEDEGAGVHDEDKDSTFNPFLTTSPYSTGLGLSMASRIVTQLGSQIRADKISIAE